MGFLCSYSFMKGSNYFLNNFPTARILGFISFRAANRIARTSSCQLFGGTKTFMGLKKEDPAMVSVRAFSSSSLFDKLWKYSAILKRRNERSRLSLYLYRSIDNVDFKEFYAFLEMADTFNSWFMVMELHIWMLLSQLMDKEVEGMKLRNEIVEHFWFDVEARIGSLKLHTPKILKKQLRELSSRFPIGLLVYDEGLMSDDHVLAGAIWYKFFDKHFVDPRKIEILVKYIRYQVQHLSLLELKDFTKVQEISQIWIPVTPYINAVMSES